MFSSSRIGFVTPRVSPPPQDLLEPEVIAWRDRVESLESQSLEPEALTILNNLVVTLKTRGVWLNLIQLIPVSIARTVAGSCYAITGPDASPTNITNSIYDRTSGIRIPYGMDTSYIDTNYLLTNNQKSDIYTGAYVTIPQLDKSVTGQNLEVMCSTDHSSSSQRLYEIMIARHTGSAPSWSPGLAGRHYSTSSKVFGNSGASPVDLFTELNSPNWVSMSSNTGNKFNLNVRDQISADQDGGITNLSPQTNLIWLNSIGAKIEFTGGVNMCMISTYHNTEIWDAMETYNTQLQGLNLS